MSTNLERVRTELLCALVGSGRSFTAYVFNKRGVVAPAVRQLAAAEDASLDALRPPTPSGACESHAVCVSSQESAELDTADALAWLHSATSSS